MDNKNGNFKDRTGEKFITNEGYEVEITEYRGNRDCDIKFSNGIVLEKVHYLHIKKGNIKNPYHKSVFGIGYNGVGKYVTKINGKHRKEYQHWRGALGRCYDEETLKRQPTYQECSVIGEWLNYQNFADWCEENYNLETMQGWALDKDILVKGNKIYSPETCCFVPQEINNLLIKNNRVRGEYPIGVTKTKWGFVADHKGNLGTYPTPELAFKAYKIAKETYVKEISNKWKPFIKDIVYQTLYNYKVEITD